MTFVRKVNTKNKASAIGMGVLLLLLGTASSGWAARPLDFTISVEEPSSVTFNVEVVSIVVEPYYEEDTELVGDINQPDTGKKKQKKIWFEGQRTVKYVGRGKPERFWLAWEAAMVDALAKRRLFRDSAAHKVSILVSLREFTQRGMGHTTLARASYIVLSQESGDVIFSTSIETTGVDHTFAGAKRRRRSAGNSISNNIEVFLKELEEVDLDTKLAEAQAAQ